MAYLAGRADLSGRAYIQHYIEHGRQTDLGLLLTGSLVVQDRAKQPFTGSKPVRLTAISPAHTSYHTIHGVSLHARLGTSATDSEAIPAPSDVLTVTFEGRDFTVSAAAVRSYRTKKYNRIRKPPINLHGVSDDTAGSAQKRLQPVCRRARQRGDAFCDHCVAYLAEQEDMGRKNGTVKPQTGTAADKEEDAGGQVGVQSMSAALLQV